MPIEHHLLPNVRAFLVDAGLVREPDVAGALPPLWLDPRDGVPAPGEGKPVEIGDPLVIGAFQVMGIPRTVEDAKWLRTDAVDFVLRARKSPQVFEFDEALRSVLVSQRAFMLGSLEIVESQLFRPLQKLGSDSNGFIYTTQYTFERRNAYLA